MYHPQVVQSPIFNDCLKVNIYGHTESQLVLKCLLRVSVQEVRNKIISETVDGGVKDARDAENDVIISDSTLRSFLPPQYYKIPSR